MLLHTRGQARSGLRWLLFALSFSAVALYGAWLLAPTQASNPSSGTIHPTDTMISWDGTATGGAATGEGDCVEGVNCDSYTLTISGQPTDWTGKKVRIQITWLIPATDYDLYVHKDTVDGPVVKQSAGGAPSTSEQVEIDPTGPGGTGIFVVHVVDFSVPPGDQYHGVASVVNPPPPPPPPTPATGIAPRFHVFPAPNGLGGSAGEPSIGVNWQTGKVFLLAGFQVLRVTFDDCPSPAAHAECRSHASLRPA